MWVAIKDHNGTVVYEENLFLCESFLFRLYLFSSQIGLLRAFFFSDKVDWVCHEVGLPYKILLLSRG